MKLISVRRRIIPNFVHRHSGSDFKIRIYNLMQVCINRLKF
jgi:hypothetical protein